MWNVICLHVSKPFYFHSSWKAQYMIFNYRHYHKVYIWIRFRSLMRIVARENSLRRHERGIGLIFWLVNIQCTDVVVVSESECAVQKRMFSVNLLKNWKNEHRIDLITAAVLRKSQQYPGDMIYKCTGESCGESLRYSIHALSSTREGECYVHNIGTMYGI